MRLHALAKDTRRVVFLEKRGKTWRLGSVSQTGGEPGYTEERTEASPDNLIASDDDVYFYQAGEKELRRIATDLTNEEILSYHFAMRYTPGYPW